tara:strand:+ start:633 stop:794 length:162 start_codon:yes stop_codon:yes gene_type:complete
MKKILLIISTLALTSCGSISDMSESIKGSLKNLDKNPCYDKTTDTIKIGCKKK